MKVYSKSIEVFLKRVTVYTREILENEFKASVTKSRFHLANGWSYPIIVVAIDEPRVLGFFDPEDCCIGINRCLMFEAKTTVIKNIIRHELAHFFLYTEDHDFYKYKKPHGEEFRDLCKRYGYGEEVYSATIEIRKENEALEGDIKNEKVIEKVQKLLSLAKSDNPNEAELATIKANQLITQHNLDSISYSKESQKETEYFTKMILKGSRRTPRMTAISRILSEFFVYPVKAREGLEITGTKANLENAEYIAHFLDAELQKIWKVHKQKKSYLKEKAFMVALANSYRAKVQESRREIPTTDLYALTLLSEELDHASNCMYGNLVSSSSSSYLSCSTSSSLGDAAGKNLNINRGVSTGAGETYLLN